MTAHSETRQAADTRCGMTLAEMMIAVIVMSIVVGAISQFLVLGVKMAQASRSENVAESRAAFALDVILREMRDAVYIESASASECIFVLPERDADGYYTMVDPRHSSYPPFMGALVPGDRCRLHLEGGTIYIEDPSTGEVRASAGEGAITNLTLTYDEGTVLNPLAIRRVNISLTARGGSGGHARNVTVTTSIGLRNHR